MHLGQEPGTLTGRSTRLADPDEDRQPGGPGPSVAGAGPPPVCDAFG